MIRNVPTNLPPTGTAVPHIPGAAIFMHTPAPFFHHGQSSYTPQQPTPPSLMNRAIGLFKDAGTSFRHFIGRTLDSFTGPFEVAELAGTGMAIPVPTRDLEPDRWVKQPDPLQFAAMTTGGGGAGEDASRIESLKKDFFRHLREKKYKSISVAKSAYDILKGFEPKQQEKNLRMALRMIRWDTSIDAVAAALLNGYPPFELRGKTYTTVRNILGDLGELRELRCDFSDLQQVSYLRSLIFLMTDNYESILLLAADDFTALEELPSPGMQPDTDIGLRASRSFFVISWILKFLNYSATGGKLEDLGLLHMNPVLYQEVEERLAENIGMKRTESLQKLKAIAGELDMLLDLSSLPHEVKYRVKGATSADKKARSILNLADTNGIRVILTSDKAEDCYAALFAIRDHFKLSGWKEIAEEYDDYIARPKANTYQSIHVYYRDPSSGYVVEIQIRTEAMHVNAEIGPASHGLYKLGEKPSRAVVIDGSRAQGMFQQKRASMINNGVYFVYDDDTGQIVKLVTGSAMKSPTILDFAFTRGLTKGLHVASGHIDGDHSSIQAELPIASRVSLLMGKKVHATGRLKYATTPLARAVLALPPQAISHIEGGLLDMDKIVRRGKGKFVRIVSQVMDEMRAYEKNFAIGPPTMKFSIERLYRRMGFEDMDSLLAVLDTLSEGRDKDLFVDQIKTRIRNNVILLSHRIGPKKGTMEVMSINDPDALGELLTYMNNHGVRLRSLRHTQLVSVPFQMSRVTFDYGRREDAIAYVKKLEDLYWHTFEWPNLSPRAITINIRIRGGFRKSGMAKKIVGIILKAGVGIRDCIMPEARTKNEVVYMLNIRLPAGRGQKDRLKRLILELEQIKGIGRIVAV